METLNFKAESALLKQFFNTESVPDEVRGIEGSKYLFDFVCRWKAFNTNVILSPGASQLWTKKEFREAFLSARDVADWINSDWETLAHQDGECNLVETMYSVIDLVSEDSVLGFELLIEAAEILKKEIDNDLGEDSVKEYKETYDILIKDFRALMIVVAQISECETIVEKHNEALIGFLNAGDKEKRKQLKKAA